MKLSDEKRKWVLLSVACGVLVLSGFQFYYFLTADRSLLQAISIMISISLVIMLLKKINNQKVNCIDNNWQHHLRERSVNRAGFTLDSETYGYDEITNCLYNIKQEVEQAEQLVNDAATSLVVNFKYIGEMTSAQHDLFLNIEKMAVIADNPEIVKLLRRQIMLAKKIDQELSAAVTSMQYGDLVIQLLKHIARQITALDAILQHIDPQNNQHNSPSQAENAQQETYQSLADKKIFQAKPVTQQRLQSGEIELF